MWVVTIGFANALRKVESDCWSLGVETAERAGGEVLAVIGGGGFAKKTGPSASHEAAAVDLRSKPSPVLSTLSKGKH